LTAFVPTALERAGDFRNTQINLLRCQRMVVRPAKLYNSAFQSLNVDSAGNRQDFAIPNVIDAGLIDPIGQAIIKLYPQPYRRQRRPGGILIITTRYSPSFRHVSLTSQVDHHFPTRTAFPAL